jgi:regulator of protease activity HflC (stomatin/prohibitin superfamily)
MKESEFPLFKVLGLVATIVVALVMFFGTYFTVGQNERVVVSSWGQYSYIADPGLHFKMPFRDSVTSYSIEILDIAPSKAVNTYTIDNQEVDVVFTVFFRIPENKMEFIYTNNRDYRQRLYSLTIDRLKAAMGQVNVQSVAENRGALRDKIKMTLSKDATSLGVEIVDFQLTDMQYTDDFRKAVNRAAVAKADIESREYEKQQAKVEADKNKIKAEGEANAARETARGKADATLLNAEAEAKGIRLRGEAEASAIEAQTNALKANAALVELRRAERWDGKLPTSIYGSAPIPFMTAK